jgi:hypothetical protein
MAINIFWTGMTKKNCAGQFSYCFKDGATQGNSILDIEIIDTIDGGSCVAVTAELGGALAKTVHCESKLLLACYGQKGTHALPPQVQNMKSKREVNNLSVLINRQRHKYILPRAYHMNQSLIS